MYHYAYLHGFASGSLSSKGQLFKALFAEHGVTMHTPDLNAPDFGRLTVTGALEAVDALVASQPDGKWRFVGSSMGGWLASLWAARNPEQVDSMCLLCPGFNLLERWPEMIGAQAFDEWERTGAMEYPDGAGVMTPLHWEFIEDARTHDQEPAPTCPILLVHGSEDETVPVESSRRWGQEHSEGVRYIEYVDDHRLSGSAEEIGLRLLEFFEIV